MSHKAVEFAGLVAGATTGVLIGVPFWMFWLEALSGLPPLMVAGLMVLVLALLILIGRRIV